ncbi:uncharacterized protein PSANT_04496 [Moesziomyces antarcticus]|uniref:Uncharacterized protein n=1 Tax=Pseudozyma antarctica TaxID=84753 RepID=A0A5C3FRF0_PSEA2|nr:uncharacterized protein PSANT_04496 [Moesziomyces antarcticus]
MLRSRIGRLYRGAGTSLRPAPDVARSSAASVTSTLDPFPQHHTLGNVPARRKRSNAAHSPSTFLARNASSISAAAFRSESFFNASQPEEPFSTSHPSTEDVVTPQLASERYFPPLADVTFAAHDENQQALCDALKNLDADYSWTLYLHLGPARHALHPSIIDRLITLQCRKPVRSLPGSRADAQLALRQVCDRVLQLCKDKTRCKVGTSAYPSASADKEGLSTLSPEAALRLLYLLVVEEEQVAASRSASPPQRRANLSRILQTLWNKLASSSGFAEEHVDIALRGRLAASLSRLGSPDAAYRQLEMVVNLAEARGCQQEVDPRPFDQLLSALARQRSNSRRLPKYLPSPIDRPISAPDESDPILRALRLAVVFEVPVSKANIHKCLQALDSPTLWWLLPFELDSDKRRQSSAIEIPDDRYALKPKWHPWQTSAHGSDVPQDILDTFAERVSLVLAQRGILQPALHVLDGLQLDVAADDKADKSHGTSSNVPDHDLFTVVLERLSDRMAANNIAAGRKSLDIHTTLLLDLRLAVKVYSIAYNSGVDLDPRINEAVIKSFAACLPSSIVDLGADRARLTKIKANIAERNESRGSQKMLHSYLRRFTTMILDKDPDLSKGALSYQAQATLLGLHLRLRDHSFSKKLYQLIRLREPGRELWSKDPESGSLLHVALHPTCRPDSGLFYWLFGESLYAAPKPLFAVQLSLDWLASGNTLSAGLMIPFVQTLLRKGLTAEFQRVLHELQRRGTPLPPRLAQSLVASLAESGYPDLAMEVANSVSQAAASAAPYRSSHVVAVGNSTEPEPSVLVPALHLMSIALDRSSKMLDSTRLPLVSKVLGLFDEFRLGLTQYLLHTHRQGDDVDQPQDRLPASDIRTAYNAAMRVRLAALQGTGSEVWTDADQEEYAFLQDRASIHGHVESLFTEMAAQDVEPDVHSWTLRITASLYDCLNAANDHKRLVRLKRTIELFEAALQQMPRQDGGRSSLDRSEDMESKAVTVDSTVVAAVMHACRRCSDLDAGMHVYETYVRLGGLDQHVQEAQLMLLAALGRHGEWQRELERLKHAADLPFTPSQRIVKQLQALAAPK